MSLADSLLPDDPLSQDSIFGVVIGLVTKIDGDPDQLGRVQLYFPTLHVASAWARVASFFAGNNRGAFFFPAVGDEVLVAFEHGDASRPYVIGALWNGKDAPPVSDPAKAPVVGRVQTQSGAYLEFDDSDGGVSITVTDAGGNSIKIDTQANTITVTSKKDIVLQAPDGAINLAANQVSIGATNALQLMCEGDAVLTASGELTISGAMVRLN